MSLEDAAKLIHFRELHLLPRTIFAIGAICFVGAFFVKVLVLGFLGVGVIFVALTLNFLIEVALKFDIFIATKVFHTPYVTILQFIFCAGVTYEIISMVYYFYRHGGMPPWLQPLPPSH